MNRKTATWQSLIGTLALLAAMMMGTIGCATADGAARAATGVDRLTAKAEPRVMTGLDVLEAEKFARLKGRKVGLICNQSSLNNRGVHAIDLFVANGVELKALFSPEHGIRGTEDRHVDSSKDEKTGLPIYSLYGKTQRPTEEMLAGIDTLVFDLQDIGARFYTYIATMGTAMEEAQKRNIRFVVLDRPNPITGAWYDGPVQDADLTGKFTAFVPMPTVHGMTVGEMAKYYQKFHNITPELDVVAMKGWTRDMYFDETGLPWVNPSPNMRSQDEMLLYTMTALVEANKNISVGRGTDRPFEYLGATWIDGEKLAASLRERRLPGLWIMPVTFIPSSTDISGRKNYPYPFHEETCSGIRVVVNDRNAVSPVAAGIHMMDALMRNHPDKMKLEGLRGLVGAQWVLDAIKAGENPEAIIAKWRASKEFTDFGQKRAQVLMYK